MSNFTLELIKTNNLLENKQQSKIHFTSILKAFLGFLTSFMIFIVMGSLFSLETDVSYIYIGLYTSILLSILIYLTIYHQTLQKNFHITYNINRILLMASLKFSAFTALNYTSLLPIFGPIQNDIVFTVINVLLFVSLIVLFNISYKYPNNRLKIGVIEIITTALFFRILIPHLTILFGDMTFSYSFALTNITAFTIILLGYTLFKNLKIIEYPIIKVIAIGTVFIIMGMTNSLNQNLDVYDYYRLNDSETLDDFDYITTITELNNSFVVEGIKNQQVIVNQYTHDFNKVKELALDRTKDSLTFVTGENVYIAYKKDLEPIVEEIKNMQYTYYYYDLYVWQEELVYKEDVLLNCLREDNCIIEHNDSLIVNEDDTNLHTISDSLTYEIIMFPNTITESNEDAFYTINNRTYYLTQNRTFRSNNILYSNGYIFSNRITDTYDLIFVKLEDIEEDDLLPSTNIYPVSYLNKGKYHYIKEHDIVRDNLYIYTPSNKTQIGSRIDYMVEKDEPFNLHFTFDDIYVSKGNEVSVLSYNSPTYEYLNQTNELNNSFIISSISTLLAVIILSKHSILKEII